MPSTITHSYFANDVYNHLSVKNKELLYSDKEWLQTTGQGMDVTYFYNVMFPWRKGSDIRIFGGLFHGMKTYDFFSTLINYIKYNDYQNNSEIIGYLYGQICHYALDKTCHPYITYKSGKYHKHDKNTHKYNMEHSRIESLIDEYFIKEREHIKPYKYKCYKLFDTRSLSKKTKEVIDFTYKEVFNKPNFSTDYEKCIKDMKLFYRIFRYDPTGLKLLFYRFVDLICPLTMRKKHAISYHNKLKDMNNILNLNHNTWYHPVTKEKHNESFLDLYIIAMQDAIYMIENINKYIYEDKKIDLKKVIGNYSYESGIDLEEDQTFKYFEY